MPHHGQIETSTARFLESPTEIDPLATVTVRPHGGSLAEISPVPQPHREAVLTSGTIRLAVILGFTPVFLAAAPFPALLGLVDLGQMSLWNGACVGLSLVWFFSWLGIALCYGDFIPSRIYLARARSAFGHRSDRWVDPHDPQARFVQFIPRSHWETTWLENAADVGFLVADPRRGEVRVEGDRLRYRIPGGAILDCRIEPFTLGVDSQGTRNLHYMVVLHVETSGGQRELILSERHVTWEPSTQARRIRRARELHEAILAIWAPPAGVCPDAETEAELPVSR